MPASNPRWPPAACAPSRPRSWQIKNLTGLNEEAAEALDYVCALPTRIRQARRRLPKLRRAAFPAVLLHAD